MNQELSNMPTLSTPALARSYRGQSQEQRRAERRSRLVAGAIAVYGERGYHQATVKAVCEAAGLTERYFYESFANSEALLIDSYNTVTYGVLGEIVRAGILAVDRGQHDAAVALGMSRALAMRRIILPQALRVIVPPAGNQFISLLKATSLVSVIAGGDLLTAAENISSANLRTIELMLVATFWYLVLTSVASAGQYVLERRVARAGNALDAAR